MSLVSRPRKRRGRCPAEGAECRRVSRPLLTSLLSVRDVGFCARRGLVVCPRVTTAGVWSACGCEPAAVCSGRLAGCSGVGADGNRRRPGLAPSAHNRQLVTAAALVRYPACRGAHAEALTVPADRWLCQEVWTVSQGCSCCQAMLYVFSGNSYCWL